MPFATINPATGKTEKEFPAHTPEEVEAILAQAMVAFAEYRTTTYKERARHLLTAAELLEGEVPVVARILTTEMGKTFAAAKAEVSKCAAGLRWFADNAEALLADEPIATSGSSSYVHYQPLGAVLAIMPWNFPMWQVIRFAAPALMVGNVGLLKHASNVPQTALAIEDLFRRAGLPDGAFSNLFVPSSEVAALIHDPRIAAVTLTGSEPAGMSVAAAAGDALKKTVLELGGSDPFVVLASADLNDAVRTAVTARVQNNGQSCIAAKRFIVVDEVADEFESRFIESMDALVVGDPFDPATNIGPIVSEAQRDELVGQVEDALQPGRHGPQRRHDPRGRRLVVRPDRPQRRHDRHADRQGRDVRSRRHGHPRPRCRRRHRRRQRHAASGSARACGAPTRTRSRSAWRGSRPAPCSSTPWWPPCPSCPSAASSARATGASSRPSASRSSPTPRPSTWRDGLTYLDHAATTPLRPEVAAAMAAASAGVLGNPTGSHPPAQRARRLLEEARDEVAAFLGRDPGEIVFTSGGTESANLALLGPAEAARQDRGEAVLLSSAVEHPAVREAARAAAKAGLDTRELPVDASGIVDPEALARTLSSRVTSVAIMTANNETGVIQPLADLIETIHRRAPNAYVFTDAVQAAPYLDLADATAGADMVSLSAHKVGGPVGVGALAIAGRVVLSPRQYGGGQERERRSGTQDVAGAVGLATALRLVAAERATAGPRVAALRDRLRDGLLARRPRRPPHGARPAWRCSRATCTCASRGSSARSSWSRWGTRTSASRAGRRAPAGRCSPATS